jgi:Helix-turn-helix domain of resolvase
MVPHDEEPAALKGFSRLAPKTADLGVPARPISMDVPNGPSATRHAEADRRTGNAIGRPRRIFDREAVVRLRAEGVSIEKIARQMSIGVGTVVRAVQAVGGRRSA